MSKLKQLDAIAASCHANAGSIQDAILAGYGEELTTEQQQAVETCLEKVKHARGLLRQSEQLLIEKINPPIGDEL